MTFIVDGTNGLTFPNSTTQASSGVVLQVVNATYGTRVTSSTNTWIDTGLTATITPKFSTSKILVLISQNDVLKQTNNCYAGFRILRGATTIITIATSVCFTNTTTINTTSVSTSYLDSPATTSATTYKLQFNSQDNNASVAVNDSISANASTITLMEIAG